MFIFIYTFWLTRCYNSLLSNVGKILEKLMYKTVYNFLTKSNIIYDLQFGLRQRIYKIKIKDILDAVYLWIYKKLLT